MGYPKKCTGNSKASSQKKLPNVKRIQFKPVQTKATYSLRSNSSRSSASSQLPAIAFVESQSERQLLVRLVLPLPGRPTKRLKTSHANDEQSGSSQEEQSLATTLSPANTTIELRSGRFLTILSKHKHIQLKSGRWFTLDPNHCHLPQEIRSEDASTNSKRRKKLSFLSLPTELRLEIYHYVLAASGPRFSKTANMEFRKTSDNGRIVFLKNWSAAIPGRPHNRSSLPSTEILRTCKQIYHEGIAELYRVNAFEATARTPYGKRQDIFRLSPSIQLDKIRHFVLITDTQVSRFESRSTYQVFKTMTSLRTLSVAMMTLFLHPTSDFDSAMEMLNLLLWVSKHVELKLGVESALGNHRHLRWVPKTVLELYVDVFRCYQGLALQTETVETGYEYGKALELVRSFMM